MIPYNNKKAHEETYTTFVHNTVGKGGGARSFVKL